MHKAPPNTQGIYKRNHLTIKSKKNKKIKIINYHRKNKSNCPKIHTASTVASNQEILTFPNPKEQTLPLLLLKILQLKSTLHNHSNNLDSMRHPLNSPIQEKKLPASANERERERERNIKAY
jgi:hypothetical protein